MKTEWIAMQPVKDKHLVWIEEQIKWHTEHVSSYYDDMIIIELEKIKKLYEKNKNHTDGMFVNEMMESFEKILDWQRKKNRDLEIKQGVQSLNSNLGTQSFVADQNSSIPQEGFTDDNQLQAAFTRFCLVNGRSSYTVNDYCSRLKNLWRTFDDEYRSGKLSDGIVTQSLDIPWDGDLLNVYDNMEVLERYIKYKLIEFEGNRNWANARAAFNKFYDFKVSIER